MKTTQINNLEIVQTLPTEVIGLGIMLATILVVSIYNRIKRKNKINFFLYNNGYVAEDQKTKLMVYPSVSFSSEFISIKNCIKKSGQQVFEEKELWEQTFSDELKSKKISEVRIFNTEIRISII